MLAVLGFIAGWMILVSLGVWAWVASLILLSIVWAWGKMAQRGVSKGGRDGVEGAGIADGRRPGVGH